MMEREGLVKLKLEELRKLAKSLKIKNLMRYRKADLIEAILEAETARENQAEERPRTKPELKPEQPAKAAQKPQEKQPEAAEENRPEPESECTQDDEEPEQEVSLRPAQTREIVYSDPVHRSNLMSGVLEVMADGYGFLRSKN